MQHITDIPAKILNTGIRGHYVHGDKTTLGLVVLKQGTVVPPHSHPQEQITYIIEGDLQMTIDGKECLLQPGMYHVIPSDVAHGAVALNDCKVIDVFSPVREDYRSK